ncbi:MAG: dihydroorotate dehydrogenase electron transfer subunit [Marinilabiliaceae bacterium]|jgi:dihydroorotate dehydrogenase electron transfer subunit|nr:dihydroorotate dehydrogenase electron transfer subunit [Marinilabiliaceae bacterium]
MLKRTESLLLLENRRVTDEYFVLKLQAGSIVEEIRPGQFVQVKVENSSSTFLRRPISVYDIDTAARTLDLLIKIAGEGTMALSMLEEGMRVSVVYPLGNSFSIPERKERILLAGGGVGVAPLFLAAKVLHDKGMDVEFLLGYRSASQLIDYDKFSKIGRVHLTTEDGSAGIKGLLTGHKVLTEGDFNRIYCCGPDPMMKAVASIARKRDIFCEVSLENLMACGFGVCLCCIEETVRGNLNTCTDGPVFNIKELKWQI